MIRVDMLRSSILHPDKRRRHQGRAWCEVADRRFEAQGPAPIYKLATLLWLHGHGGADYEVHDGAGHTVLPFGSGLPMRESGTGLEFRWSGRSAYEP